MVSKTFSQIKEWFFAHLVLTSLPLEVVLIAWLHYYEGPKGIYFARLASATLSVLGILLSILVGSSPNIKAWLDSHSTGVNHTITSTISKNAIADLATITVFPLAVVTLFDAITSM